MSLDALATQLRDRLDEPAVLRGGDALRVSPADGAGIAIALEACAGAGHPAAIRGAGTRPALAAAAPVVISTERLGAIDVVDGDEGVLHAAAGAPISALRAAAHAVGWDVPLDPVSLEATLGGVLASAESPPRLRGLGRPRDVVLGMEVVLGSGERARCGGRVVKNVSGYDLAKLWIGSRGALCVIEGAWLRLRPRSEAVRVVLHPTAHASEAVERARRATDLACARAVLAVDREIAADVAADVGAGVSPAEEGPWLLVELAGPAALVESSAQRLAQTDGACVLDAARFEAVHRWLDACARASDPSLRLACAPSRLACAMETLRALGARSVAHPDAGLVHARLPRPADLAAAHRLGETLHALVRTTAAQLRVEGGDWPEAIPLVDPLAPRVVEILRSLKRRFDPRAALAAEMPGLELGAARGARA